MGRRRSRIAAAVLAVAAAAVGAHASAAAAGGADVEDLTPDEVEALTEDLDPFLGTLKSVLAGDAERAALGEHLALSGLAEAPDLGRGALAPDWSELAADGDAGWLGIGAALPGEGDVRTKSKVVGARVSGDGVVALDLRIELARRTADDAPASAQATLHVEARVTREDGAVLPLALALQRVEGATRRGPAPLVERTRGVFADAPEAARILGVGMDRWAQRLDDPGLTAWFGHQGLAAGDVDGDGRPDLYVPMPAGIPNMLFVQTEGGRVEERAAEYGLAWLDDTKGAIIDDIDGEPGNEVVSALGHVLVVQSRTGGRRVATGDSALGVVGWAVAPDEAPFYSIASADLDGDGAHELFGTRYVRTRYVDSIPVPFDEARNGPENCLFRFDGKRWVDVTREAGLIDGEGGRFSLAASFVDVDRDGRKDLYVVNDFGSNRLFLGRDGVRFEESEDALGAADAGAGMGASFGDVDGDGDLDLYVTNMFSSAGQRIAFREGFGEGLDADRVAGARRLTEGSALFLGRSGRFERYEGPDAPTMGRWGWGGVLCDVDLDGRDDVIAPAGFITGPKPGDL